MKLSPNNLEIQTDGHTSSTRKRVGCRAVPEGPTRLRVELVLLCFLLGAASFAQETAEEPKQKKSPVPQPQAHAHNDYEHKRPLFDALDHGFCSVESDVFAIEGELRVAHNRRDTKPGRTLEKLYLDPLMKRFKQNGGAIFKNGPPFTLLIDFKTKGAETYALLKPTLAKYKAMLAPKEKGKPAAVSIVISGNRPFEIIEADKARLCGIDGRLTNLDSKMSSNLMPLISDNWRSHFKWRGEGEIPEAEKVKLLDAVKRAHAAGRRVRFWATPENEKLWKVLADAGVDHINTDQLARLEKFLKMKK